MKFRTTIDITAEAADKNEAMEIAGEYLSGNLVSGVDMKCRTRPICGKARVFLIAIAVALFAGLSVICAIHMATSRDPMRLITGVNAIQPPLKTYSTDNKNLKFRKDWRDKQTKEALTYIKVK